MNQNVYSFKSEFHISKVWRNEKTYFHQDVGDDFKKFRRFI